VITDFNPATVLKVATLPLVGVPELQLPALLQALDVVLVQLSPAARITTAMTNGVRQDAK